MEKYMRCAINEAMKAKKKGDVPVGAIIVYKNKIIAKAHNKKEIKNNAVAHAEILAIQAACKKMKTWHLDDCTIYITMEPCMMCCGAIEQSRIKKVVYGIKNENFGWIKNLNRKVEICDNVCIKENKELIQSFFKEKRK